jgi:nitrile hydratase
MSDTPDGHRHHSGTGADNELGYYARRAAAIEALLIEKGLLTSGELQSQLQINESRTPGDGARVVARAWANPDFKQRLLADPRSALAELGYGLLDTTPMLVVVENTDRVHYMVVCTLCSCYPRALLGRPPDWYKSLAYRSRAVTEPRSVMREFGLELSEGVEVRVLDSTADLRYLVLPRRPAGTEHLDEERLSRLVSRDSMIGVTEALDPQPEPVPD